MLAIIQEPAHAELVEARTKAGLMSFWTYILECSDGSYYVGHTDDLEGRLGQHSWGVYPGYTATRRPVTLRWAGELATRDDAFAFERRLKGWSRAKKEAVIRGDWAALPGLAKCRASTSSA